MDPEAYREYLRRAEVASSIRELRLITREAGEAFPGDPQLQAIDDACWGQVERLLALSRRRAPRRDVESGAREWNRD